MYNSKVYQVLSPLYFLGMLGFVQAKNIATAITDNNPYNRKQVIHTYGNNGKEGEQ